MPIRVPIRLHFAETVQRAAVVVNRVAIVA